MGVRQLFSSSATFAAVLFFLFFGFVGHAQSVLYSSISTGTGTAMVTGTGTAFVSADGFTRGPGLTFSMDAGYASRGWTTGASVNSDDYVQFSATIGTTAVNLGTLEIRYDRDGSGPKELVLEANGIQIYSDASVSQVGEENMINLSSVPSLQNLQNTTVIFRLFGFNASSESGDLEIEDIDGGDVDVGAVLTASLVLPVNIDAFTARAVGKQAEIQFSTATEQNNSHFLVQRSGDGRDFKTIGRVEGKGDSDRLVAYTFVDERPIAGVNYYRLQQYDFDGASEVFGPVAVYFAEPTSEGPKVWPVPASDELQIDLPDSQQAWELSVFNLNGQLLLQRTAAPGLNRTSLALQALPAGTYLLRWKNGRSTGQQKFIKQ